MRIIQNNFYDNEIFFEGYKEIRENQNNYNDLLEQPAMHDFLPALSGRTILDLGCGYGGNSLEFVKLGAKLVMAIDISCKMLEVAKNKSFHKKITYRQLDMADLDVINQKFDIVYSALAFHYVEDFDKLMGYFQFIEYKGHSFIFSGTSHYDCNSGWPILLEQK